MKFNHHSISIHFVQLLIQVAEHSQLNIKQLLNCANLNSKLLTEPKLRITPMQFSKLIQYIWQHTDDEFLGLTTQKSRFGVFSLMAKQAVHYHDLHSVYRHISHFYNLTNQSLTLELNSQNKLSCFSMALTNPEQDPNNALQIFLMLIWHRFPSWLIGQTLPLKSVYFTFEQPENLEQYQLLFPCPIYFKQKKAQLVFADKYLAQPIVQTPKALRHYLKRAPLDWFTRQNFDQVYSQKVINLLLKDPQKNMQQIADLCHVTSRTLRRKLTEEGSQFKTLKSNLQRDNAIHLLSKVNISIAEIAQQLGFSEPAAFTRAFKKWTGVTPKTYRIH